jgi:cytochrome c oxidase cbb3-type subunit 1
MISFAILYWLVPQIWHRPLANPKGPTQHFWLATIGIVIYTVSMWAAGLMEGVQWRQVNEVGLLSHPVFLDIVARLRPFYWLRLAGGAMYLAGAIMMAINLWRTIRGPGPPARATQPAAA